MDKFTEVRQTLGKAIYALLKRCGTSGSVECNGYRFFARGEGGGDQHYIYSMGWEKYPNLGVMGVRRHATGKVEDAISDATTLKDLQECLRLMPVAEAYMLAEQKKFDETEI